MNIWIVFSLLILSSFLYYCASKRNATHVLENLNAEEEQLETVKVKKASKNGQQLIGYHLPLVMEKLLMCVEAGQDILTAVKTLVEDASEKDLDPVTKLLADVLTRSESGLDLSTSLYRVAQENNLPAVKHVFIYLAQSHRDGGELVVPLRELSDATGQHYQESVEENIARLPVKATLPLLVIFAGLILVFITAPVLQVIKVTSG